SDDSDRSQSGRDSRWFLRPPGAEDPPHAVSAIRFARSPLEPQRLGEKLHERRCRRARAGKQTHELGRADFLARELGVADKVLALEILDQRMVGVVASGR